MNEYNEPKVKRHIMIEIMCLLCLTIIVIILHTLYKLPGTIKNDLGYTDKQEINTLETTISRRTKNLKFTIDVPENIEITSEPKHTTDATPKDRAAVSRSLWRVTKNLKDKLMVLQKINKLIKNENIKEAERIYKKEFLKNTGN